MSFYTGDQVLNVVNKEKYLAHIIKNRCYNIAHCFSLYTVQVQAKCVYLIMHAIICMHNGLK